MLYSAIPNFDQKKLIDLLYLPIKREIKNAM